MDHSKVYDVPQPWMIEYLKMFKSFQQIVIFITRSMENWRMELIAEEQSLEEIKIQTRHLLECDDTAKLYPKKIQRRIEIHKIAKINYLR